MPWTAENDPFEPRRRAGEDAGRPMLRFHAYSVGEHFGSCCTSLTDRMAVVQMNLEHSTWLRGEREVPMPSWEISPHPFGDGTPNGSACPDGLAGCRHVMLIR